PDVVVHDILTLAPALAAELEDVPRATLIPHLYPVAAAGFPPYSSGARLPRTRAGRALWAALDGPLQRGLRMGRAELNEVRRRLGLPALSRLHGGLSPELCLVGTLPQLEYPRAWPETVHVVGPLLWEPPVPEGSAWAREGGPAVVIAPSTSHDPAQRLVIAGIEGLARRNLRVLASIDRRPPRRGLRASPATRLVNWVSYAEAMRGAAAVVCHGGHGTVARALVSGAPLVVVPHSGDMAENAARVDWAGVGVRLPWRLLTPGTLRLALGRVLAAGAGYTDRAAALALWAAAHDGAGTAAELVEGLARK
ncbi:MAG: glycosyltransferase, partial [Solirubrobacteraceae bacterium]